MKKTTMLITVFIVGIAVGVIGSYLFVPQPESPYLKDPERLGDVVAALQVMATYKYDNNLPEEWKNAIGSSPKSATSWSDVFNEHSSFFRTDENGKVSLVWRRSRQWSWDNESGAILTKKELDRLSEDEKKKRIAREPLTPDQTAKLIEIAINMQTQEIARRAELRWWIPVLAGLVGVVLGVLLKRSTGKELSSES